MHLPSNQASRESLPSPPGGTRTDLNGVGEKAFYETLPGLEAHASAQGASRRFQGQRVRGPLGLVAPVAQDSLVKQGLASFANTLLMQSSPSRSLEEVTRIDLNSTLKKDSARPGNSSADRLQLVRN